MRRLILTGVDAILGWKSRLSGAVSIGRGSTIAWRRIRRVAGNALLVGEDSIVHADISFEEAGGKIQIGDRTFIGRSHLICYRSLVIGDDVIMSWGIYDCRPRFPQYGLDGIAGTMFSNGGPAGKIGSGSRMRQSW